MFGNLAQRTVQAYLISLAIVSNAVPSLAQTRLFFTLTENHQLCQVLDVEFTIKVTARSGLDNDIANSNTLPERTVTTGQRTLESCNREIVMDNFCQGGTNQSWVALRFPQYEAMLKFNFSTDGDTVYLRRSFVFSAEALFSDLSVGPKTEEFRDPNVLNLGGIQNSYHCNAPETTCYTQTNSQLAGEGKATYTVSVHTEAIRVQAFSLDQPPSGLLGPVRTCEKEDTSYDKVTAVIVGSSIGVVIVVLLATAALILIKRRRQYDQIGDD
ncbi:hypothetical protein ElyMa_004124200 [Elysia marginata]|uniref:Lysosome-associated membrane glycoprotein 1 n=1 Tax=Elysia marginata TaxID=1093978 RepID=A0AAV4GFK9_9GAST|nr:hypothetical protein ElyMa_004124200 [Elysia marginata]